MGSYDITKRSPPNDLKKAGHKNGKQLINGSRNEDGRQ